MRKMMIVALAVIVMAVAIPLINTKVTGSEKKEVQSLVAKSSSDFPMGDVKEYQIQSGDTFAGVMTKMGVPYEETLLIISYSKEVFDLTKMNTGKLLKLVFINEAFAAMEYPLNSDEVIHVKKNNNEFKVTKEDIPYVTEPAIAKGAITDSLFVDGGNAGLEDKTIMELADIFSSDIDFTTEIQKGDSFSVVYEKRLLDGKDAGAGKILAAKFTNNNISYLAFRYNDKFYDEGGESLTRQFLKSPLNYSRISSGFTYNRKHPITKQVKPHRAIDYAAPNGTPVIATGDGKVITAGSRGGLGITVEIKHGSYLTQYTHLSKIAKGIKNGVEVDQGDLVGYVGSTGISTGPHLQYAMFENGNPINPLVANFSREKSIPDTEINNFNKMRDNLKNLLN